MATLFHSSIFLPFSSSSSSSSSSSHKLFLSPHHHHLNWNAHQHPLRNHLTFKVSASSSANKSSRSGRKVKSNEELCNDIREFLSTVGLPNDHVPTMKELSDHGRGDLANIVRRRGYKLVRELLASPTKTDFDGFIAVKGLADNVYGIVNESDAEESEEVEHSEYSYNQRVEAAGALNGSALTAKQSGASATVNHPLRDDHWATEAPINADFDNDFDVETSRVENELEINHLKFMLHQKEMELSQLKEQIEKEQHALSVLQTKAETEINKAQKLISEKDAELQAVEETLTGLEEVQIQYSGDGEIVELAGSFNGWHQRVKMDPQPSSSIIEPIGPSDELSRKSRHWSTVLWLYPGIYEIKFIVDGQWRIDPQRESVTRGGIMNNILRVDR